MTLTDRIKSFGRKVKKATKPALIGLGALGAFTFLTPNQASAQIEGDTLWATGFVVTQNAETGSNVGLVDVTMRPETVQMYTPDTVFNYVTDGNGLAPFNVIAYVDSTTGLGESEFSKNTKTWVWNDRLNIELPENVRNGEITIYDISGRKIGTRSINSNKSSVSLDGLANSLYVIHNKYC